MTKALITFFVTVIAPAGRCGTSSIPRDTITAGTMLVSRATARAGVAPSCGSTRSASRSRTFLRIRFARPAKAARTARPMRAAPQGGKPDRSGVTAENELNLVIGLMLCRPFDGRGRIPLIVGRTAYAAHCGNECQFRLRVENPDH